MSHLIAPSVLAADFANLQRDIELINKSEADWFHIDIMDGNFVPNISYGMPVLDAINRHATKPLDVHAMIEDPDRYVAEFVKLGADVVTVHLEACRHIHRTIQLIKDCGAQAGVALNPGTPISGVVDIIADLDLLLVMSVNPGFGGQKFIEKTYDKVAQARQLIDDTGSSAKIEVDGGVGPGNFKRLVDCGADVLVAGSAVFASENPLATISTLKESSMTAG